MLPVSNVQLTKVHYYDRAENDLETPTVSRDVFRRDLNKHVIIKRNVFGHKWVLKINECQETQPKRKFNAKVVVYVWVFCCIVVAISFGVYFSLESKFSNKSNQLDVNKLNQSDVSQQNQTIVNKPNQSDTNEPKFTDLTTTPSICDNCDDDEVCLKTEDFITPLCVKIKDKNDPTGCGGLCQINVQHCKLLDDKLGIYQCKKNARMLHCPKGMFNCGNMCIDERKRCDGFINCSNRQDEKDCECDLRTHFHCGNQTSCIEMRKKCDGTIDCWDKSDEIDCFSCESHESPCFNGKCINKAQICDGRIDCADKSDEPLGC